MPRTSFAAGMLRSATPGLSRLAQSLAGDPYEEGFQQEAMGQSKMAQALSAARASQAQADLRGAQADSLRAEQKVLESRPSVYEEQAALSAGADVPLVRALRESVRTGYAPVQPMGPPTPDGQMGVTPLTIDPKVKSAISRALIQLAPIATNTGDLNPEQMAKARGLDRVSALSDAIIAGTADRNTVGGAQAAVEGKPLFNVDGTGAVLDQYGGKLDTSNPLALSTIGLRKDQAGASRASAANSYASAGQHRAATDKINLETTQLRDAPKGRYDPTIGMIIDERGATARPVLGPDGQPIGGRVNDKPLPPSVVKQLTETRDNAATINRLSSTFQPDFGGKGLLGFGGDLQLGVSGNLGRDQKAVEWWKNYRKQSELVERHALFGAALTPGEQASWQSADIAPQMNPEVIKRNLATRAALAQKVFENSRADLIDAGNNPKRIDAIANRNTDVPGLTLPSQSAIDAEIARRQRGGK